MNKRLSKQPRRHRAHYGVNVMILFWCTSLFWLYFHSQWIDVIYSQLSFMIASLIQKQSWHCPSGNEIILKNMGKSTGTKTTTTTNHNKTVHIKWGVLFVSHIVLHAYSPEYTKPSEQNLLNYISEAASKILRDGYSSLPFGCINFSEVSKVLITSRVALPWKSVLCFNRQLKTWSVIFTP